MTVTGSTSRVSYTGNGSTTSFAFPFKALEASHVKVYTDGVLKASPTHYSVSGTLPGTGTVVFVTAPANGVDVDIFRIVPVTQETDYVENDNFPAETHESALDKATMLLQQHDEELGRAIKLALDSDFVDIVFPEPGAGQVVGWNAGGTALKMYDLTAAGTTPLATLSGYTRAAIAALSGAAGQLVRATDDVGGAWMHNGTKYFALNAEVINVKEKGALGDGVTDDTAAIVAALAAVSATYGGIVYFPPGLYLVTPNATTKIVAELTKQNTKIIGAGRDVVKIKVANGVGQYVGVFVTPGVEDGSETDTSGLEVRGITFDANLANNAIASEDDLEQNNGDPGYEGVPEGHNTRRSPIQSRKGTNMVVDSCRFIDTPRQSVFFGGNDDTVGSAGRVSRATVSHNVFQTTVSGVGMDEFDTTSVFIRGRDCSVYGNFFLGNPVNYWISRTAVQATGPGMNVSGNLFRRYYRAIVVGCGGTPEMATGVIVERNIILEANGGIELHSDPVPGVFTTAPGVRGAIISRNFISLDRNTYRLDGIDDVTPYGVRLYTHPSDTLLSIEHVDIDDNVVISTSTLDDDDGEELINVAQDAAITGTCQNVRIRNNTAVNSPKSGVAVSIPGKGFVVAGNTAVNPGIRNVGGLHNAGVRVGNVLTDSEVIDNRTIDTRGTHLVSAGVWLGGSGGSGRITTRGNMLRVDEAVTNVPLVHLANNNAVPFVDEATPYHVAITNDTEYGSTVVEKTTGCTYFQMARPSGARWIERDRASTPAQITANQNDYSPGLAEVQRWSSDISRNVTGVAQGVDGRRLVIMNIGAANIVLMNQDAASAAANRIITGTGGNLTMTPDDSATLIYDDTTDRWRVVNTSSGL